MTTTEKIALIPEADLRMATAELIDAVKAQGYLPKLGGAPISKALRAFEPSPIDIGRDALKAAGLVRVNGTRFHSDGSICFSTYGTNCEFWNLPESAT
jgi:hypothetical protein